MTAYTKSEGGFIELGDSVPKPLGFTAILPSHVAFVFGSETGDKRLLIPGMVWPRQSALRSHPCVALSSAPVLISVNHNRPTQTAKLHILAKNDCRNTDWQVITIMSWE